MTCDRCAKYQDARKCAFPASEFSPDNHDCATLSALREAAETAWIREDAGGLERQGDAGFAYLGGRILNRDCWLVLTFYKKRARVEQAWLFFEQDAPQVLTLAQAEALLMYSGLKEIVSE